MTGQEQDNIILKTYGLGKEFNGVWVLDDVDFDLRKGEIHALVGENGAGKSTFIKMLSGVYSSSAGTIEMDDKTVKFATAAQSEAHGIRTVQQEINMVEYFSIYQNIFIGAELKKKPKFLNIMDDKTMKKRSKKVMEELGVTVDVRQPVASQSVSTKKIVDICKVLVHSPQVIIFDEPTVALGEEEREKLLSIITELKNKGLSIIFISHNFEEVKQISDRVTVFRDGKKIVTVDNDAVTTEEIVKYVLGGKTYLNYKRENNYATDNVVLEVDDLTNSKLDGISFRVKEGEVVGIAGVVGAGKSEIAKAIYGVDKIGNGRISFGKGKYHPSPGTAIKNGVAFIPEERRTEGIIPDFPLFKNVTITYLKKWAAGGVVKKAAERKVTDEYIDRLSIKTTGNKQIIRFLSGGNQQKGILSRWLAGDFRIGIFDEPTKGIDIKAKEDVYMLIDELAKEGKSILVMSSYLPELLMICDRILVVRDGKLVGEFTSDMKAQEHTILATMMGRDE